MFLRRQGYSKRFTFDVIYSAFQKSFRRGDVELAIEMGYEFQEYPNALKKRLIQNCTEDCPDLYLINNIYVTEPDIRKLMAFIPVICKHIKNHEGCYGMRIACEMEPINSKPNLGENCDDLLTLLRKCLYYLINDDIFTFISYFQQRYPHINLMKIYNYIGKHNTFLFMLCVWETRDYMHEKYKIEKFEFEENKIFDMKMVLPSYIYDKHVRSCPKENKTYEYFINNLILFPRKEETDLERQSKELYISSNIGIGDIIRTLTGKQSKNKKSILNKPKNEEQEEEESKGGKEEILGRNYKVIQTQLITGQYKSKVYYCSINENDKYEYILKGPFIKEDEMKAQILSDIIKQKLLISKLPNNSQSSYSSKIVEIDGSSYILSNNFIPIDKDNVVIKSSKLEENVKIYNGNKYFYSHELLKSLTKNEIIELLKILAFRKIIGTNDTCSRNIIYFNKHLYSIDDPVLLKNTNYMFKIHYEKYETEYNKVVFKYFDEITKFLNEWDEIINSSEDIPENVQTKSPIFKFEATGNSNFLIHIDN